MAKTKEKKPEVVEVDYTNDPQIQDIAKSFVAVLAPFKEAADKLDEARQGQTSAGDMSIRALAEQARKRNDIAGKDDEDTARRIKAIAKVTAASLYTGGSVATRASEYATLLTARDDLPAFLNEIDKIKAQIAERDGDAAKPVHARQYAIKAARLRKKMNLQETLEALLPIIDKEPTTKNVKLASTLKRLAKEKAFKDDDDAQWALSALIAMVEEGKSMDVFTHPDVIAAMEGEPEDEPVEPVEEENDENEPEEDDEEEGDEEDTEEEATGTPFSTDDLGMGHEFTELNKKLG